MAGLNFRPLIPIMIADFFFWAATVGMSPLMSRMVAAAYDEQQANTLISNMILTFTVGAIAGRLVTGARMREPKAMAQFSTLLSVASILIYFTQNAQLWMIGQAMQGFAMGMYGIASVSLVGTLIPSQTQLRGFALVGVADFLGFSSGPILCGIGYQFFGLKVTLIVFLLIAAVALVVAMFIPNRGESGRDPEAETSTAARKAPFSVYLRFLPLAAALFISLLFHQFYSRYLPLEFDLEPFAIETLFFTGYVIGGLGFRIVLLGVLEKLKGWHTFALGIGFMTTTAVLVSFFPNLSGSLNWLAPLTGVFYGMGFEILYIFTISWCTKHTREGYRAKVLAFVFLGFDTCNIVAGLSFGALANAFTPMGLMRLLLVLAPLYLLLPLFLKHTNWAAEIPPEQAELPVG